MSTIVKMTKLAEAMDEATVTSWHKKEGDHVDIDDLLAEVDTDKATFEFRSTTTGTLLKVLVGAGNRVAAGDAVAIVGAPGEDISALVATLGIRGERPVKRPITIPLEALQSLASPRCKFCGALTEAQRTTCTRCGAPL